MRTLLPTAWTLRLPDEYARLNVAGAVHGIGRLIDNYAKELRTPELFVAAIVSSLFGILIFVLVGMLSERVLRSWHDSAARAT